MRKPVFGISDQIRQNRVVLLQKMVREVTGQFVPMSFRAQVISYHFGHFVPIFGHFVPSNNHFVPGHLVI